jgi:hypothetical protein
VPFRVRSDLSRSAAATEQAAYGFGSVDDIAVTHCLPRLSECPERFGVSLDLSGFPCCQEKFDREHNRLMDTAAVFFGSGTQLIIKLSRQS